MSKLTEAHKTKLSAILSKFGIKLAEEQPAKLEFKASAKLADGSEIHTTGESFEVGADVFMVSAEGEQVALPDGEYSLEDGKKITCSGGLITEVGEKEEDEVDMKTEIDNLKKAMTEMQEMFATEIATLSAANEKLAAEKTDLQSKLTKLSKLPANTTTKVADVKEEEIVVPSHIKTPKEKEMYLMAVKARQKREAAKAN